MEGAERLNKHGVHVHGHEPDSVAAAVAAAVGFASDGDSLRRYLKSYLVPASNPRMLILSVDCRDVVLT